MSQHTSPDFQKAFPDIHIKYPEIPIDLDLEKDGVQYLDEPHTYTNLESGKLMTSVTTKAKEYFPEINYPTYRTEQKFGWSSATVKKFWKMKGDYAMRRGNYLHNLVYLYIEKPKEFMLYFDNVFNCEMQIYMDKLIQYLSKFDELIGEPLLFDKHLNIAGRPDIVGKYKEKLYILDLKTNLKSLRSEYKNTPYHRTPLNEVLASKLGHYTVQINTYRYLYEKMHSVTVDYMLILQTVNGILDLIPIKKINDKILYGALSQ